MEPSIKPWNPLNASWNFFRYAGDYVHDAAVVFRLLDTFCLRRSVANYSMRTQAVYLTLHIARYLDLLDHAQNSYLVFHKIFFISTSLMALISFRCWWETYQKDKDTCPALSFSLLLLFICPWVAETNTDLLEVLWTWSQALEGFAMVPQYVCSYRNAESGEGDCWSVSLWVCLMGSYRFFYLLNWLFKKSLMQHYWDPRSWLGGLVNLCFFADYLLFLALGASCLRKLTLTVDDGLRTVGNELTERFGGCLLSPGQRYVEIVPPSAPEAELSSYQAPQRLGVATE
ncbi:unnamed protein product [Durusdinium trenchii]|uniref:ER lumen protein-retaining receptor (HDEL receptor) (PGP169-12) n=3 Tax=Durusdinium trenchii TaxID=1381693 RepID=A0ABP0L591_9DINO